MSSLEGFDGKKIVAAQAQRRAAAAAAAVKSELKPEIEKLAALIADAAKDREEARKEREEAAKAMEEIQELRGALLSFADAGGVDEEIHGFGEGDSDYLEEIRPAAVDLEPLHTKIDTLWRMYEETTVRVQSLEDASTNSAVMAEAQRSDGGVSPYVERAEMAVLIAQVLRNNSDILDEFLEGGDDGQAPEPLGDWR